MNQLFTHCLLTVAMSGLASENNGSMSLALIPETQGGIAVIDEGGHFHVLLENKSDVPITIWRGRERSGYLRLTFKIKQADGSMSMARRRRLPPGSEIDMSVNIYPGTCYVYDVYPSKEKWEGFPKDGGDVVICVEYDHSKEYGDPESQRRNVIVSDFVRCTWRPSGNVAVAK